MTELNPMLFKGDGIGENATDFLNAIRRRNLLNPTWKDPEKLEFFELSLKSGGYATSWYNKLVAADKDTFAHLVAAFQKQWPEKEMVIQEKGELQEELLSLKLQPEQVGVRVEEDGIEEWGQVRWAVKVAESAARIGDDGGLIPQALKNIPDSLLLCLGPKRKTWAELFQTMKDIPAADVAGARRLEDRLASIESLISTLQQRAQPQTPTRGLSASFSGMSASSPARRVLFPQPPATTAPARAYRADSERLRMIQAAAVTIHPRNQAGLAAYMQQITAYAQKHGTLKPSEERPYPLTTRHHHRGLWGMPQVRWRQIIQSIRTRAARTNNAVAVNIVADASEDIFGTAEYDHAVIEDVGRPESESKEEEGESPSAQRNRSGTQCNPTRAAARARAGTAVESTGNPRHGPCSARPSERFPALQRDGTAHGTAVTGIRLCSQAACVVFDMNLT
ncbi:hypothetical protein B0H10DRAFT_2222595 [Mycena sp. CBHHK59/15]|nr:hypothetical protein B0H10DRAFT_2222595 [Mycena sp. CBHHK59/15]